MAKILIVEDDLLLLKMYRRVFVHNGFEVETAGDGKEGFEKAKKSKFSLIITDVMMPKMNGLELLEKLKKNSKTTHIPLVILTNLKNHKEIEAAYLKGAAQFIIKNEHDPKKVLEIVKTILGK